MTLSTDGTIYDYVDPLTFSDVYGSPSTHSEDHHPYQAGPGQVLKWQFVKRNWYFVIESENMEILQKVLFELQPELRSQKQPALQKWYFVTKIVLTDTARKNCSSEIRGLRFRIFEITRTIR